ncbi:hypothetical protein ACHAPJ_003815 [Fusarium lateritium]
MASALTIFLQLVVMSATISIDKFCGYFNTTNVFEAQRQVHSICIKHVDAPPALYETAILATEALGHILIFMTHASEIERMCVALSSNHQGLRVIPLYSSLPAHDQSLATRASDTLSCIVSTNVAEASVAIPGVGYVIDCGLKKEAGYNYRASMSTLLTAAISQDSARQRAGRAGRTQAGVVYRLYTKEFRDSRMPVHAPPGICTEEISGEVLRLKSLGFSNVTRFDWLDPPHPEAYLRAIGELEVL